MELPDNVDVTYVFSLMNYANDPAVYAKASNDVKKWYEKLGKNKTRLTIWLNIVDPSTYTSYVPFMYPHILKKWLDEHSQYTDGYFINGLNPRLSRLGERGRVTAIQTFPMVWIQSRLLWDPTLDPDQLLRDFCKNMYGPAADTMLDFYSLILQRWEGIYKNDLNLTETDFIHTVRYPVEEMEKLKSLINKAYGEAAEGSMYRERIKYYRDNIYAQFFNENDRYHEWADKVPSYRCFFAGEKPLIDGDLSDKCWQNAFVVKLVKRQWGEASDRKTEIKMAHDGSNLYIGARLFGVSKSNRDKDELRINVAKVLIDLRQKHNPNMDNAWDEFREIRINANGQVSSFDDSGKGVEAKAGTADGIVVIEARIPLEDLKPNFNPDRDETMRVQFIRYWDDWKNYDTWSPMLSHISDYSTYRFGILQFIKSGGEEAKDGTR